MTGQLVMTSLQEAQRCKPAGHRPVMLTEVIEHLKPQPGHIVIDGTLGLGGHAEAILKCIGENGRLIGMDCDNQALSKARENLAHYRDQCDFVYDNFRYLNRVLTKIHIDQVDGILLDLGLSSFQLDNPQRGFGFMGDGPLDMRMDESNYICAFDLVNAYSEKEISWILKEFGQERWHQRIARFIVSERARQPIATTRKLRDVVVKAIPRRAQKEKIHPATRTFQAFRIAVNRELENLAESLDQCSDFLKVGGRICVIAFHSLEDRIVKQKFRYLKRVGKLDLVFKKPLRPSENEITLNPRARSARLRCAERKAA